MNVKASTSGLTKVTSKNAKSLEWYDAEGLTKQERKKVKTERNLSRMMLFSRATGTIFGILGFSLLHTSLMTFLKEFLHLIKGILTKESPVPFSSGTIITSLVFFLIGMLAMCFNYCAGAILCCRTCCSSKKMQKKSSTYKTVVYWLRIHLISAPVLDIVALFVAGLVFGKAAILFSANVVKKIGVKVGTLLKSSMWKFLTNYLFSVLTNPKHTITAQELEEIKEQFEEAKDSFTDDLIGTVVSSISLNLALAVAVSVIVLLLIQAFNIVTVGTSAFPTVFCSPRGKKFFKGFKTCWNCCGTKKSTATIKSKRM